MNATEPIPIDLIHAMDALATAQSAQSDTPPVASLPASYTALLQAAIRLLPCDAAALLKLEEDTLHPVAVHGLTDEAMQRRFSLAGHPRLDTLMRSNGFHRFPADCGWPDPYDGLVLAHDAHATNHSHHADELLPVHDCMGAPLFVAGRPWGVVTFDALCAGTFDTVDDARRSALLTLLQASLAATEAPTTTGDDTRVGTRVGTRIDTGGGTRMGSPTLPAFPPTTVLRTMRRLEGQSPAMQQLIREVDTVAASDLTVLILGETGVGKELVAQRLHEGSRRAQRPLVQVNCAALPETLADSELFGHRRGAFTGATQDRTGKFELASGGTLLLDEVGELPLSVQAKLLRTLQSGDIQRPGSDRPLRVDVRVVAATNRDLRAEVAAGRFRADLYHRLAVYPVHVPPLRERGRDLLALAGVFLEENQHRLGARNLRLSPMAREALLHHDWPGNVRELEHLISRAALRAWAAPRKNLRWIAIEPGHLGLIAAHHPDSHPGPRPDFHPDSHPDFLPDPYPNSHSNSRPGSHAGTHPGATPAPYGDTPPPVSSMQLRSAAPATQLTLRDATEHFQQQWLVALLARHPSSMAAAAREAGMDRSNFHRLLKKLGLLAGRH